MFIFGVYPNLDLGYGLSPSQRDEIKGEESGIGTTETDQNRKAVREIL